MSDRDDCSWPSAILRRGEQVSVQEGVFGFVETKPFQKPAVLEEMRST